MTYELSHQEEQLAFTVEDMAREIFRDCESVDDFCIQHVASGWVVFGGHNRLILDQDGWRIDRPYCTEKFLRLWDERAEARHLTNS